MRNTDRRINISLLIQRQLSIMIILNSEPQEKERESLRERSERQREGISRRGGERKAISERKKGPKGEEKRRDGKKGRE